MKDKFAFFNQSPIPERRKAACKTPHFLQAKRAPFSTPFKLDRVSFSTLEKSTAIPILGPFLAQSQGPEVTPNASVQSQEKERERERENVKLFDPMGMRVLRSRNIRTKI